MYLLAMTMVIIGVLGSYTQVLALQTARLAATQNSFAQAMIEWHNTALALVQNNIPNNSTNIPARGCALTWQLPSAIPTTPAIPICTGGSGALSITVDGAHNTTPNCISNPSTPPCKTSLPVGYSSNYEFYSLAYTTAVGQILVMTFLLQPTTTPPFLVMPSPTLVNGATTSFTQSDLQKQMINSNLSFINYGTVDSAGANIVTKANSGSPSYTPVEYPLPTSLSGNTSLAGILAIVSAPNAPVCPTGTTYQSGTGTCS